LSNQFKLQKILLWEHLHRILSGERKELAPLLVLLYEQPDPGLMDVQKNLLSQIADPKLQADLLATAIIVDIRTFGRELVLTKFGKEVNMLKDTSLVQSWIAEGRQEGWQEGQKEGQKEGQRQGKLVVLQSILIQKFGVLVPPVLLKLQGLSTEQLDRLTLTLLNIASQEELQAWLENGIADSANN
jgi:predicted transposase YdaD